MREAVDRIGKYEVVKQLGAGFFGTTYLARDIVLDRMVALKVYKPHAWLSIEDVKREVRPLVMLEHANVIRYVDCNVFTAEGGEPGYYVATEYAKDGTLKDCLPSLTPAKSIAHCKEILSGLAACHRIGILHRDLKPDNLLMSDGVCKIGDFGIARIDQTSSFRGDVAGTPIYMAPEQFPPLSKTSRRSDLWSVAVVLYEMLYKQRPFSRVDEIQDPACRPQFAAIPRYPRLSAVVRQALSRNESDRFQSAELFAQALDLAAEGGAEAASVLAGAGAEAASSADVTVTLCGLGGGRRAPAQGTRLLFYTNPLRELIDENPGTFDRVPDGSYLVEGYYTGTFFGEEFWMSRTIRVGDGLAPQCDLVRSYPYMRSAILRRADSLDVLNSEKTVPSGTAIELTVAVVNSVAATPLSCQVRWVVESIAGMSADRIDETSAFQRVEGTGGTREFGCRFSLLAPGRYRYALALTTKLDNGNSILTDSSGWMDAIVVGA